MGYASYETPFGPAGYGHADICNQDGCEERIDRGLAYLCGDQPGYASEGGCGRWFCGGHLFMPPEEVGPLRGGGFCGGCMTKYEEEEPGCWERDEAAWMARHAPQS